MNISFVMRCTVFLTAAILGACSHSGVRVQQLGQKTVTLKNPGDTSLLPRAITEFRVTPLDVLRVEVWQSHSSAGPFRFETHNSVRISLSFDSEDWVEVAGRGMRGWLPAGALNDAGTEPGRKSGESAAAENPARRFVDASSLYVRKTPAGEIIGRLASGAAVTVTREQKDWALVAGGNSTGWVSSAYLSPVALHPVKQLSRPQALRSRPGGPALAHLARGEKVGLMSAPLEYRIMNGDWLRINFLSDPQLDFEATVRPDGKITLPRICELRAEGKTPVELAGAISQAYSKQIHAPGTTVSIVQANTMQVESIGGEYTVRPDGKLTLPMLGEFSAGGATPESLAAQISAAAQKRFHNNIGATAIITDFIPRSLLQFDRTVTVLPDGTIILPETGLLQVKDATLPELRERIRQRLQKNYNNQVDVSISLLESANRVVYVSGEVKSAGSYPLTDSMTVMRALMQAGGVTPQGDLDEVVLIHYTGPSAVTVYTTNLQEVLDENRALQDMLLSPQDIIFVPQKGVAQANLFVEQYITNMLPFSRNVSYNYNKNRNNDASTPSYYPTAR